MLQHDLLHYSFRDDRYIFVRSQHFLGVSTLVSIDGDEFFRE